jgi:hypothetical protein
MGFNITQVQDSPELADAGATAPTKATQIGGTDGTNLQAIKAVDLDTGGGTDFGLEVSIRLPGAGGSVAGGTATNPIRTDPTGTTAQPVTDGGGSLTVDGTVGISGTVPVSVASLPLPSGAATETTLSAINTKAPNQGQAVMAASIPVAIASNQSTVPVSIASSPLPTGAATEATLSAINTKTPVLGQTTMAASQPVVMASDQSAIQVVGAAASATALVGNPVRIAGSDGTLTKDILTDTIGNIGIAGLGLSGFTPDPSVYQVEPIGLTVDSSRNLNTRSRVLSDEGSFRDDFPGASLLTTGTGTIQLTTGDTEVVGTGTAFTEEMESGRFIRLSAGAESTLVEVASIESDTVLRLTSPHPTTGSGAFVYSNWATQTPSGGSIVVSSSEVTITPGTTSSNKAYITQTGDYLPMSYTVLAKISQRIANQEALIGFIDDVTAPGAVACIVFDGTSSTTFKFRTSSSSGVNDTEETTVDLQTQDLAYTTAGYHTYEINIVAKYAILLLNGRNVAQHRISLPGPYQIVNPTAMIRNTGGVGSNTSLVINQITLNNANVVELSAMFGGVGISGRDINGIVREVAVDTKGRLITVSPGVGAGFTDGRVTLAAASEAFVSSTVYTEQSSNAQRSIVSTSASDTAAGTGARTAKVTYYTAAMLGPFTETVTLNGTTPVNMASTTICFVESIDVLTVGSTGSNVGTINLKASTEGGGVTIWSIEATANRTFGCHHYVRVGSTCSITGVCGTIPGQTSTASRFLLKARNPLVSNSCNQQITDTFNVNESGTGSFLRTYVTPFRVVGPARITGFAHPYGTSSRVYGLSFDFFEEA